MKNISRRTAVKTLLAGGAAMAVSGMDAAVLNTSKAEPLKGNIRHSVSKWCFGSYPLEEFCEICKEIGIESIELLDPKDWPVVQKHGLTVAMCQGAGLGIDRGFNDPSLHDELVASYEKVIPMVAEAGLTNLICFAGRRNGVTDLQGWENCEKGLKRLIPIAEKIQCRIDHGTAEQCRPQRLPVRPHGLGCGTLPPSRFAQFQTALRHLPHADYGGQCHRTYPEISSIFLSHSHWRRARTGGNRRDARVVLSCHHEGDCRNRLQRLCRARVRPGAGRQDCFA